MIKLRERWLQEWLKHRCVARVSCSPRGEVLTIIIFVPFSLWKISRLSGLRWLFSSLYRTFYRQFSFCLCRRSNPLWWRQTFTEVSLRTECGFNALVPLWLTRYLFTFYLYLDAGPLHRCWNHSLTGSFIGVTRSFACVTSLPSATVFF